MVSIISRNTQHAARSTFGVDSITDFNGIYNISQHAARSTLGVDGPKQLGSVSFYAAVHI